MRVSVRINAEGAERQRARRNTFNSAALLCAFEIERLLPDNAAIER
jgi:hypothetical protein